MAVELLERLRGRGIHVDLVGDAIRLLPAADVTRDDVAIVRAHMHDIAAVLRQSLDTSASAAAPLNMPDHIVVSERVTARIDSAPNDELNTVLRRIAARMGGTP